MEKRVFREVEICDREATVSKFIFDFCSIWYNKDVGDIMKIAIIGGGASGLLAAIKAKNKDNEVSIYEKNNVCGKKILITGNGRCNYFNDDFTIEHYHSKNLDILKTIITEDNKKAVLDFFKKIGIISKQNNGYYYPFSNQAVTIEQALITEAQINGINIINNIEVTNIEYDKVFKIITNDKIYEAEKVVLATGSYAAPKTGSTGIGYELAKKFGHTIIKPLPALVQLKGNESYFKDWAGIRTDVKVSLIENNQLIKEEIGEIQLTNYGVSGICVFQLSSQIVRGLEEGKKEELLINFVPSIDEPINCYLDKRNNQLRNRTISQLLDGMLNYKLVNLILKKNKIKNEQKYDELTNIQKQKLCDELVKFKVNITGYNDFDSSQVCSGGIPLDEINIETMESKYQKNLYIIGELLDVDGECGGYNLGFAWLSGILSGNDIKENI